MRVVSWNCNGALHKKHSLLDEFEADVLVIQECENPSTSQSLSYRDWAHNHIWVGTKTQRGLGVFAKQGIQIELAPIDSSPLELFLPCIINQSFHLLAVWTKEANSPTFQYIGQLWKFLQSHAEFLATDNAALIGDLNSNARWDIWDRWWNHSDVVDQLKRLGLISAYHQLKSEQQGHESVATFYMQRKLEKAYHIDYAFLSEHLVKSTSCVIGEPSDWLHVSDHMPLVLDIPFA
jgi:endonuclease/exonuclease/phosphatase family metal-dependent hydrolase